MKFDSREMIKTRSLSSSDLKLVWIILFIFSSITYAGGFDSLLQQLQELGDFTRIFETKVELNVKDYGAKGDGIGDDTQVIKLTITVVLVQ